MNNSLKHSAPLVSIGVASYNNDSYVIQTLESIRLQTYKNWELIIIDDCSTDNSVKLIRSWLTAYPELKATLVAKEINRGVCHTLNSFLGMAKGKYVSTIGSDDIFSPDKLTRQVALMEAAPPKVGLVYTDLSKIDAAGNILVPSVYDTKEILPFAGDVWLEMLKTNFLGAMTLLIRRECFTNVGFFDENLAYEDWDMWLRLARKYEFLYLPEITCYYRIHGNSFMHKRKRQLIETNLRIVSKHLGVSSEGDSIIHQHIAAFSEELYLLGSSESVQWLNRRQEVQPSVRGWALLQLARLGVPANRVAQAYGWLKQFLG
ncbi:glycosyltransferase [Hymenobacter sp. BT523]|uniref:glycosyltransferase n=1 Tax=Hymenobacter sp. BT523 TaxID=2795725 RepID=UPI0018EB44DF|nr:glycosyltransferase [Hymenobacter sp. BT523]MBJ6108295.1 glycosyltransferase [Hymenobacter sp. BT523]